MLNFMQNTMCAISSAQYNYSIIIITIPFSTMIIDPGTCFACDMSRTECSLYFVNSERSSVCVETTAYTLLALLSTGDTESTVCLSQWLVRIRNGAGGYYSSQVHSLHWCNICLPLVSACNETSLIRTPLNKIRCVHQNYLINPDSLTCPNGVHNTERGRDTFVCFTS